MTKDEALTLALEALEFANVNHWWGSSNIEQAITAIKEALAQPERDPWRAAAAQPEQKPVAWEQFHEYLVERNFCPRCGKRIADLGTIHTCTPPIAADPKAFYGFPSGSVSTPNAGGKCVTAGETAPVRPNGMLTVEEVTVKEIDPNQWAFDRGLEST